MATPMLRTAPGETSPSSTHATQGSPSFARVPAKDGPRGRGAGRAAAEDAEASSETSAKAFGQDFGMRRQPTARLSLKQLQEEVARVEEACRYWQSVRDEQYLTLPPGAGNQTPSGRGRRGKRGKGIPEEISGSASEVQKRVITALSGVSTRKGMEQLVQAEVRDTQQAEAKVRQLQPELEVTLRDSAELTSGLPELLSGRTQEVDRHRQGVQALEDSCTRFEQDIAGLRSECRHWQSEASKMLHLVEAWPEVMRPLHTQKEAADTRARELEFQCSQARRAAKDVFDGPYLGAEGTQLVERLKAKDIPKLQQEATRMEALLADMRQRLEATKQDHHDKTESRRMAARLELETLERSLAMRTERLRAKEQEIAWLRERAGVLEAEVRVAKDVRDREHSARVARPLEYEAALTTATPPRVSAFGQRPNSATEIVSWANG